MKISVVIPAYNEERTLPLLLADLEEARQRYAGGRDEVEIIVANNLSTDATVDVARHAGSPRMSAFYSTCARWEENAASARAG